MERFYPFFGHTLKRDIDLLRFLYLQKRFVPIEEISQALALDRRSIQKSFDTLSKRSLSLQDDPSPLLVAKHGFGLSFIGTKRDYKRLSRQLLEANPFFYLLETLLLQNEINLIQFAADHYFSESTVRKRIYALQKLLAPLGFQLQKQKGTVRLVGSEARIRYFMMVFFWRTFAGLHWPFTGLSQKKCETIAQDFYQNNQIPFNPIELKMTTYILAVTILRFRKGQRISAEAVAIEAPLIGEDLSLFQSLIDEETAIYNHLSSELAEHFFLDENERRFCFLWLASNLDRTFADARLDAAFSPKKPTTSIQKLLWSMTAFAPKSELTRPCKSRIVNTLLNGLLTVELFGPVDHTLAGYNTAQFLAEHFPDLQKQAEKLVTKTSLYQKEPLKRSGFSLHVAMAWTLILPPATFQQKIKIKLETDLPLAISLTIRELIKAPFQGFYNLDIRDQFVDDDYDLCLSTTPLSETYEKAPVLLINAQVTVPDLLAIHQAIEVFQSQK